MTGSGVLSSPTKTYLLLIVASTLLQATQLVHELVFVATIGHLLKLLLLLIQLLLFNHYSLI